MKMTWANFKAICDSKVLSMQMIEASDNYRLFAFDGDIKYETSFFKDAGSEQTEFEASYKASCNQKIGAGEAQPFAVPAYRTKLNATPNIITIAPNTNEDINYVLTEERYVTGGSICIQNAVLGDYIEATVSDIDEIIPSPYRAALCEAWPIVGTYIEKNWIEVQGEYSTMRINTYPLNAKITAGLYLSIKYYAVNSGSDRKVVVNYHLTKKL
jgi:hypothetical protein